MSDVNPSLGWAVTKSGLNAPVRKYLTMWAHSILTSLAVQVELREIGVFIPENPPKDALFDFVPVKHD